MQKTQGLFYTIPRLPNETNLDQAVQATEFVAKLLADRFHYTTQCVFGCCVERHAETDPEGELGHHVHLVAWYPDVNNQRFRISVSLLDQVVTGVQAILSDQRGKMEPVRNIKKVLHYIMKDGNYFLNVPAQNLIQQQQAVQAAAQAAQNVVLDQIMQDNFDFLRHVPLRRVTAEYSGALTLQRLFRPQIDFSEKKFYFIWGKPGTGKSHYARNVIAKGQRYYSKMVGDPKWFDGYNGEPVVIYDDVPCFSGSSIDYFKLWTDKYALDVEVKTASAQMRATTWIFTSNHRLEDVLSTRNRQGFVMPPRYDDFMAVARRITHSWNCVSRDYQVSDPENTFIYVEDNYSNYILRQ